MTKHHMSTPARLILAAATLLFCSLLHAQPAPGKHQERFFTIEQHAPGLEELVKPGAEWQLLGDRYGLTEGAVWIDETEDDIGHLLFADLISNVIYRWDTKSGTTVFLEEAGWQGPGIWNAGTPTLRGRMYVFLVGPNGITLDSEGRIVWCAAPERRILRLEKDGSRTVIADKFEGKRFSGPNDLVYRSDGALFFTETIWGMRDAREPQPSPERELPITGVFMVKDGKISLLLSDKELGDMPNGLAFSPDEKHLYLNANFVNVMRYDVAPDGSLSNGIVFIPGEGSDGMKVDTKGNLYTTSGAGPGEVRITSPEGVRLGVIKLPILNREPKAQICATNVAFGDADSKGLYITACEHVYRVQMEVAGIRVRTG